MTTTRLQDVLDVIVSEADPPSRPQKESECGLGETMLTAGSYPIAKGALVTALRDLATALEAGAELGGFSVYRDVHGVHRVEAHLARRG
jgi:hypothetical protein